MKKTIVTKIAGLGFGLLGALATMGCAAETGTNEELANESHGEALTMCRAGVPCVPGLPAGTHGVEVKMDAFGQAASLAPDTSYAGTADVYTLQADVPMNVTCAFATGGPFPSCTMWHGTPVYPSNKISAVASVSHVGLPCDAETLATVSVEGWDATLAKWVSLGNVTDFRGSTCGGTQAAVATIRAIDLKTASGGRGVLAVRVHGLARATSPIDSVLIPVPVEVRTVRF